MNFCRLGRCGTVAVSTVILSSLATYLLALVSPENREGKRICAMHEGREELTFVPLSLAEFEFRTFVMLVERIARP